MGKEYSALMDSIEEASSRIASAMEPSYADVVALVLSGAMLIATIVIIAYNARTVTAALKQVEESQKTRAQEVSLGLYPLRRDLLKTVEGRDAASIGDIGVDIELLLPGSLEAYREYIDIQESYDDAVFKKRLFEDDVTSYERVDEQGLLLARRIKGECSDEDVLEGRVGPFSGMRGFVFNPDTEEEECLDWDDLDAKTKTLKAASEEAYGKLRSSLKAEIAASLKLCE